MTRVGLIGLGLVGSALAERWLRVGHQVVGYDLSGEARECLAKSGGSVVNSVVELPTQCDVIVLSLPDGKVVERVIDELWPRLTSAHRVVDTTTAEPEQTSALGERLAERGVPFVDATIAGSSAQVRSGEVIVMAGGHAHDVRAAAPLLDAFAAQTFHVGAWGAGARMKLVVNLVLGLERAVLAEGLGLAAAMGLDLPMSLAVLQAGPAYSRVMDTKGAKMLSGDFTPQARLSQHLKDVRLILQAGERTGARLPLSAAHRGLLEQAEAAGLGELDNSAIARWFGLSAQPRDL